MLDFSEKPYKLFEGDCLEIMRSLPDNSVDCVITDPPYNIGKDSWDSIVDYHDWMQKVFLELQRVLKDNGSLYWFHSEMSFISKFMQTLENETNYIFRQFIVWNKRFNGSKTKGFLDGYVAVEELRNYQQMAEYILYYTFQDETGLSKVLPHCVYPIRAYIRDEIIRAKGNISLKEINTILGTATNGGGVASATLSLDKTYPTMMTREHYNILRKWLNNDHIEYLRQEYEYLRQEYEDLRSVFNNQKTHHSVWDYEIETKQGHLTPKPLELLENIILHSTNENQIILDCFLGSGQTIIAGNKLNRNVIGIEKDAYNFQLAKARIKRANLEPCNFPQKQADNSKMPLFENIF